MTNNAKVLLLTPPFTQLGTPYPATVYLKGFFNTIGVKSFQADIGLEVICAIFSREGLRAIFDAIDEADLDLEENVYRMSRLREAYISSIDPVIDFLQNKNPTLAYSIVTRRFLPEASRFDQIDDLEWAFGTLGVQDQARHLATLFLEDIGDLLRTCVDTSFGFSRYAERLARSASSFDEIDEQLRGSYSYIDTYSTQIVHRIMVDQEPDLVCLSIPFPGNLYGGLRIAEYVKRNFPKVKVAMGGGYPNTELRSLSDPRVFDFVDYVTLDDGERPLANLLEHIKGSRPVELLKRAFVREKGEVKYYNGGPEPDVPFAKTGTPDYGDLPLNKYLSTIELTNPMHRLWSDGRWNKLTMAHGCYWKKCTFCDVSLDYIEKYEPIGAKLIVDRMVEQIKATGETGFHFVDEAAPPSLMKEVALEIIRRNLSVSWWTNIRFEKRFTADLCRLLKASGCIAVSGGLEVASDRLLVKMKKGVTVAQVAQVARNFTDAGIMVHAYLMYGFPTQTAQETIDSLELVRQMMALGIIQSGFWHQFAMTAHSPVGLDPLAFGVVAVGPVFQGFAHNDLIHEDPEGCDHEAFSKGLETSLFNYMNGICLDSPLQDWFDFKVPMPSVSPVLIELALNEKEEKLSDHCRVVWLGTMPEVYDYQKSKKGKKVAMSKWLIYTKTDIIEIPMDRVLSSWLVDVFPRFLVDNNDNMTFVQLSSSFELTFNKHIGSLMRSPEMQKLRQAGLYIA